MSFNQHETTISLIEAYLLTVAQHLLSEQMLRSARICRFYRTEALE